MNKLSTSKHEANVKNARNSLLLIIIFSVLNIALYHLGRYFIFSSYVSTQLTMLGYVLADELSSPIVAVLFILIGVALLVPYLLAYIFSKKNGKAWMIVALVLFSIDTLLVLLDVPAYLDAGEASIFIDLAIHVVFVVQLAIGVNSASKRRKELIAEANAPAVTEDTVAVDSYTESSVDVTSRSITVTRKKAFAGMAVGITVCVDGTPVAVLKNGQSIDLTVPGRTFELGAVVGNGVGAGNIVVPSDSTVSAYTMVIKMGAFASSVDIKPVE